MQKFLRNFYTTDRNIMGGGVGNLRETEYIKIVSSSSNPNTVVRSYSYLIHPTLSKISDNKPNANPCQLYGTTRTSPTHITVFPIHLLTTSLTITDPKPSPAPPSVPNLFAPHPNLPQDHPITSQKYNNRVNPFTDMLLSITSIPPPTYIYPLNLHYLSKPVQSRQPSTPSTMLTVNFSSHHI